LRQFIPLKECLPLRLPLVAGNEKIIQFAKPLAAGNCQISVFNLIPKGSKYRSLISASVDTPIRFHYLPDTFRKEVEVRIPRHTPAGILDNLPHELQGSDQGGIAGWCKFQGQLLKERPDHLPEVAKPVGNDGEVVAVLTGKEGVHIVNLR
jgi:hypothetical protein